MRYRKDFDPPYTELIILDIDKDMLGKELISEFLKRMPGLKLEYAYISDNTLSVDLELDYLFIFSRNNPAGEKIIFIEAPAKFTSRSLCGFYYAKTHNLVEEFFKDIESYTVSLPSNQFLNYITKQLHLSRVNTSPDYWKNINSVDTLLDGIYSLLMNYGYALKK